MAGKGTKCEMMMLVVISNPDSAVLSRWLCRPLEDPICSGKLVGRRVTVSWCKHLLTEAGQAAVCVFMKKCEG
jgi:hypothetical protein